MTIEPKKPDFECTSDEFRVAVQGCGVKVEIDADGKVTVFCNIKPVNSKAASRTSVAIGEMMADGTIYAGASPKSGKPMYTTPNDEPLSFTFEHAIGQAQRLHAHGHRDWRVPTRAELDLLFLNRAAIGNFNTYSPRTCGWYWSSTRHFGYLAWAQRFSDGFQDTYGLRNLHSALRCVRG